MPQFALCGLLLLGRVASLAADGDSPLARRRALQEASRGGAAAVPALTAALKDENPIVRRTAARLLARLGDPAEAALASALESPDHLVRRTALTALCDLRGAKALPSLAKAVGDPHASLRLMAVHRLAALKPRNERISALLKQAGKDKDLTVRKAATRALWPFHKETVSLRDRPDWDHDVKVVQTIPLPKDGWRFKLDPEGALHVKKCFDPAFDDSAWDEISIEQAWQKAGYKYVGVAWYRRVFTLPAKPALNAVEIRFKGVDECAWVWVNGQYVGQHDLGPSGWNVPFTVDVTKELKWGGSNQITVRAMNTAMAGGIWRPVAIEVLQ